MPVSYTHLDVYKRQVIVSGTTIENIAGGQIETYFTPEELRHL